MDIQGVDTKSLAEAAVRFRTEQEKGTVSGEAQKQLDLSLTKYKEDAGKLNKIMDEVRR
jgi:hypothetical protein